MKWRKPKFIQPFSHQKHQLQPESAHSSRNTIATIFTAAAIRRNYIIYDTLRGLEKKIYIIKHNLEYDHIGAAS